MDGIDRVAHDDHDHERPGGIVTAVSVVVAGGGTAGHIEPAMALADAVRRLESSARITALGTEKGLDRTLIPPRGYSLELIPPVPLPRKMNSALLRMPGRVNDAVRMTADVLVRANADVIVGFGGYVALPAYLAARRARLPIVVHEANARPGVANRLAARLTHHVYTASEQVRLPHAVAIGIPLRPAISGLDRTAMRPRARSAFGLLPDAPTLLVTGGSQGAQSLNRACAGRESRYCTSSAARTPWRYRLGSHRTRWCPSWSRCISPTRRRISCCADAAP